MLEHLRSGWVKVISPVARFLIRLGIKPDYVTWIGTIATVAIALSCFPNGWLWQGICLLLFFILSDSLDGTMARLTNCSSKWGAFLDSSLDRIADGAVLGGLTLYLARFYDSFWLAGFGIAALTLAQVTSYTKARGESLGVPVHVGIAGRADRLVISLLGALLTGFGVAWALPAAMVILTILGVVTVIQRMLAVYHGCCS